MGIDEGQVDDAMDSDEPKAQLIELLVKRHVSMPGAGNARVAELRRELQELTVSKLVKRATADGVLEKQVEAAVDSDDPKSALVELVLAFPKPEAEPCRQRTEDAEAFPP